MKKLCKALAAILLLCSVCSCSATTTAKQHTIENKVKEYQTEYENWYFIWTPTSEKNIYKLEAYFGNSRIHKIVYLVDMKDMEEYTIEWE